MSRYSNYKRFRGGMQGSGVPLGFGKGKDCAPILWFLVMWLTLTDTGNAVGGHFLYPIIDWFKYFNLEDKEILTLMGMGFFLHVLINFKKED